MMNSQDTLEQMPDLAKSVLRMLESESKTSTQITSALRWKRNIISRRRVMGIIMYLMSENFVSANVLVGASESNVLYSLTACGALLLTALKNQEGK